MTLPILPRTGRLQGVELDTVLEENGRILSSLDGHWTASFGCSKSTPLVQGQVLEANGCPLLLAEKEFARPPALGSQLGEFDLQFCVTISTL